MKLRPIHSGDAETAAAILARGFPVVAYAAWLDILTKLFAYCGAIGEQSVGRIVEIGGEDVGICLAIPSERRAYTNPPRKVVNISSFFLEQKHQWMAPLVMKRVMASRDVEYTDLTATPAMRKINERLGFVNHSRGAVLVPVPLAALMGGRARVLPLDRISPDALSADHLRLLEQHAGLGCISVGVEIDRACHPLILVRIRRRGVPGARVVLARDRALIRDALGPLGRRLLRERLAFLEFEGPDADGFPLSLFWRQSPPFQSTRDEASPAVDHAFSELVFF